MQRPLALLYVPVLAVLGASVALLFPFSAEDAFITYRYAENFVETGALVFNRGEPVLALTSPLHALFSAGLHVGTGRVVLANKIVGVALLVGAAGIVMWRFRGRPAAQLVAICILLLPPCVALWSVGGLETPMLLLLVSLLSCAAWGGERRGGVGAERGEAGEGRAEIGNSRLLLVFVVAGLAFLTRYDSVLFTLPVLVHVTSRARSTRAVTAAAAVGAALPVALAAALGGSCSPESFEAGIRYRPRPEDVFVVTQMRSGTTWMQYLVYGLLTRGAGEPVERGRTVHAVSAWLEAGVGFRCGRRRPSERSRRNAS